MLIKGHPLTILACAGMAIPAAAAAQTAPAAPTASAQTTPPATPAPAAKRVAKNSGDQIVCTREPIIGSKFTRKVCTTLQSQADRKLQDQQFLNKAQTPGYTNGN